MFQKEIQMHLARIMAQNGHSQKFIAQQLGVTDRTVRNYLNPEYGTHPRKKRDSILAPYYPIIDQKLDENPYYNLVTLNERLQNAGYPGGMTILSVIFHIILTKSFHVQLDHFLDYIKLPAA